MATYTAQKKNNGGEEKVDAPAAPADRPAARDCAGHAPSTAPPDSPSHQSSTVDGGGSVNLLEDHLQEEEVV